MLQEYRRPSLSVGLLFAVWTIRSFRKFQWLSGYWVFFLNKKGLNEKKYGSYFIWNSGISRIFTGIPTCGVKMWHFTWTEYWMWRWSFELLFLHFRARSSFQLGLDIGLHIHQQWFGTSLLVTLQLWMWQRLQNKKNHVFSFLHVNHGTSEGGTLMYKQLGLN